MLEPSAETSVTRIAVPESAQARLRDLYVRYLTARRELTLFLDGLARGLGLDMEQTWDLDIEMMELLLHHQSDVSHAVAN